jgi:hypothetical protein
MDVHWWCVCASERQKVVSAEKWDDILAETKTFTMPAEAETNGKKSTN